MQALQYNLEGIVLPYHYLLCFICGITHLISIALDTCNACIATYYHYSKPD